MSSQPNTPQPTATPPSSAPTETVTDMVDHYPPSPPLPLETQKYDAVTPNQLARRNRKESYTDKCPSFGPVSYGQNIFALDRQTCIDVRLFTKVDRGFFLADNDWTCYRRNYFQVSGSFSLGGIGVLYEGQDYPCYAKDTHGLEEISCFMLGVNAKLSDCDKSIPLIQHTPKRDKGPQITPLPKPIRPGGNLGFSAVGSGQTIVTFERLQFKTATANNGKRRAAQQYYVIVMELIAKLKNGNMITIASTTSSPVVVRGRSPGHYAETDGVPARTTRVTSPLPPLPVPNAPQAYDRPQGTNTYAGHNSNNNSDMFHNNEYIPYEYQSYSSYGHMPASSGPTANTNNTTTTTTTTPTTPMSHSHSYPGTPHLPVVPPQPYYAHERTPSASTEYPANNYSENGNHVKAEHQQPHHPSPYYWQRNEENHSQEGWNRIRMASNNSTHSSMDQHGSPYMHPHHQEHPYYSHSYGHSSYGPPSLPPPTESYPGYHHYEWQRPKYNGPVYSHPSPYDPNDNRRHEYSERHVDTTPAKIEKM
ncbi:unnamed protein product [Rhizopus stolonifer]